MQTLTMHYKQLSLIEKMYNALNCLFEDEFTVYRQQYNENNTYTEEVEVGTVVGDLQQLDAERAEQNDLEFRKGYVFTTDSTMALKEGDRLRRGNETYSVQGIRESGHRKSSLSHKSLILSR